MYEVIATLKSEANQQVKAFWIVKAYKTHNAAQKRLIKLRKENNSKYDFEMNIL